MNSQHPTTHRRRLWIRGSFALFAVSVALPTGCSKEDADQKVDTLTGVITRIDLAKRTLTLEFQRKNGDALGLLVAIIPPDAKIFVNGAVVELEELRIGEKATGYGKREKRDGATIVTALEIHVERHAIGPTSSPPALPEEQAP